jgi:hypothetical protein
LNDSESLINGITPALKLCLFSEFLLITAGLGGLNRHTTFIESIASFKFNKLLFFLPSGVDELGDKLLLKFIANFQNFVTI